MLKIMPRDIILTAGVPASTGKHRQRNSGEMHYLQRKIKMTGFVSLLMLFVLVGAGAQKMPRGLWLLPRKDTQNTARADVPGRMKTAPKEVWRYGSDTNSYAYLAPVKVQGKEGYF